jgi:hypothetical protein
MARATITAFAAAKGFDIEFLRRVGVTECERGLRFRYRDLDGSPARTHVRPKIESSHPSTWEKDAEKIVAYGSHLIRRFRDKSASLAICEGESDALSLWYRQWPAIALPGTTMHALLTLAHVEGFGDLLIAFDNDEAGERAVPVVAAHLRSIGYIGRIRRVNLAPYKDVSELHLAMGGA